MKKICIYLFAAFMLSSIISLSAQNTQHGFIIRKSDSGLSLVDVNESAYSDIPTDRKGRPYLVFLSSNKSDPSTRKEIETSIFTGEEILRHLQAASPHALCTVDTAGNIVSVSFNVYTEDLPVGEIEKFAAYREKLKKEVTYEVEYSRGLGSAGFQKAIFTVFVYEILSQKKIDDFNVNCYEIATQIFCDCSGFKFNMYQHLPAKNEQGEVLDGELSFRFSERGQLREIEQEVFSEHEQQLLSGYRPTVTFAVKANSGQIVELKLNFQQVTDTTIIDKQKMVHFKERVMSEIIYEQIQYDGKTAASGYLLHRVNLFVPDRKTAYSIPSIRDMATHDGQSFLITE